ncbi:DUF2914 domain-containing protein [Ectothiorhodospira mobilis]|uniref:DUF2914 domain-containing protein n=1 Tax=Ectothiorhodospira mobilis TaxID=195064 RepID=UPI001EE99ED4|nr:DUF2914 domain-containing protein [Ectothiorhodospira mobilis]MCG5535512.1 DUF2914 domain-containing protein [Ectothiorhodospira mobilis]
MRHPNPLRHLLPRLAVPTVLALALPLQTAAAHHHGETNAPTLRLAQSGGAPTASGQPASPPDGTDDTGMPEEAVQTAPEDAPEGSPGRAGNMDRTAPDGDADGDGISSEAMEEAPRSGGVPQGDASRDHREARESEGTRSAQGGNANRDRGDEERGEANPDREEDSQHQGEDRPDDHGSRDEDAGPHGRVARAAFTSGIEDREPVDRLETVDAGKGEVLFFTEIRDHEGGTIIHQWRYQGWDMGEVRFDVDGPRWRVWSSKTLRPEWTGPWTVRVMDQDGRLLDAYHIQVTAGD